MSLMTVISAHVTLASNVCASVWHTNTGLGRQVRDTQAHSELSAQAHACRNLQMPAPCMLHHLHHASCRYLQPVQCHLALKLYTHRTGNKQCESRPQLLSWQEGSVNYSTFCRPNLAMAGAPLGRCPDLITAFLDTTPRQDVVLHAHTSLSALSRSPFGRAQLATV